MSYGDILKFIPKSSLLSLLYWNSYYIFPRDLGTYTFSVFDFRMSHSVNYLSYIRVNG